MDVGRPDVVHHPAKLLGELTGSLEAFLASRRWVIGDSIIGTAARLVGRRPRPTAADVIRDVIADVAVWGAAVGRSTSLPLYTSQEAQRLAEWMKTLDEAFHSLLMSRRWRIGNVVVSTTNRLLLRPQKPTSVQHIEELIARCRRYREEYAGTCSVPTFALAELYYRLGFVREKAKKWSLAAVAYEEALRLGYRRPVLFFRLGRVRARLNLWMEAAVAFQEAVKQSPTKANWFFCLAEACERCGRLDEADRAYKQAIRLEPVRALYFHRRAGIKVKLRQWNDAVRLYKEALRLEPARAETYYELGRVREQTIVRSPAYSAHVGLHVREQGDWEAAAREYTQAIRLKPSAAEYHFRLGHVYEQMRDFAAATGAFEEAVRLKPSKSEWLYRLGRAREQNLDLDGALRAYRELLLVDPRHARTRSRMYTLLVKLAQWDEAAKYAGDVDEPPGEKARTITRHSSRDFERLRSLLESKEILVSREEVAGVLERSEDQQLIDAFPVNWWFALHWRFLNIGWFSLAYRVKDIAARLMLSSSPELRTAGLAHRLAIGKALVQLGRREEVSEGLLSSPTADLRDPDAKVAVTRLLADIDAFYGDFTRLRAELDLHRGVNRDEAEEAFVKLIRGRSVAIVGPVDNGLRNGAEIDSFDVVIRTNFLPGGTDPERARVFGHRTDVSYFNGVASKMLAAEIETAVSVGGLRMIVLRPFNFTRDRSMVTKPSALRYNPSELTVLLRARSFGVQRIMHDVLRYSPANVKLFNVDFFLSNNAYQKGYKARELLADSDPFYLGSGHDYRADFLFTKHLRKVGLISADAEVGRLLELPVDSYLRKLDAPEALDDEPRRDDENVEAEREDNMMTFTGV